jgi:hypothetical protein
MQHVPLQESQMIPYRTFRQDSRNHLPLVAGSPDSVELEL